jgi:predicted permease
MLRTLAYDLKHAGRGLVRSPGFTAVVVLSLVLGVGANTAIFSLIDQALLRPLPVKNPEQLVLLSWNGSFVGKFWGSPNDRDLLTHMQYRELVRENQTKLGVFRGLCARKPTTLFLSAGAATEPVASDLVSGECFQALGVGAALGRVLEPADDQRPGEHPVVVLSYDYWKRRLGAPADIVGRKVIVNGQSMTVVGVAQNGFRGIDPVEARSMWLPTMMQARAAPEYAGWLEDPGAKWLHVVGRLAPGKTAADARRLLQPVFKASLEAITRHEGWPRVDEPQRQRFLAGFLDARPAARGRSDQRVILEQPLLILLGATGLVLLLACLNVASLFLARAFARRKELAVRAALGASGGRMAQGLALQTGLLVVAGALGGLLVAPFVARALLAFVPETVTLQPQLDARVFVFSLVTSVITGLLFGIAPAVQASRAQPGEALKQIAASAAGGLHVRRALVVGQVALALVLLTGAGLFVRTLGGLRAQAGYAQPDTLTFNLDLSKAGYAAPLARERMMFLLESLRALPQVESAGLSRLRLLTGRGWTPPLTVGPGQRMVTEPVGGYMVSPGFFASLGIPFVAGSDFRPVYAQVGANSDYRSAIVSESFVRRYLPNRYPLGARLGFDVTTPGATTPIEIQGVVKDFRYRALRLPEVQVFFPALEKTLQSATFFVRTRGDAENSFQAIRDAVRKVDASVPVVDLRTLEAQIDTALVTERFLATLATAFAALAILMAVLGLYGVLAFVVTRRTREIGIRMALGISPTGAVALIVREAASLVGVGLLIGLPSTWALARLVENQLYGVQASDAATLMLAVVLIAVVALIAAFLPARRASAVNPSVALRAD